MITILPHDGQFLLIVPGFPNKAYATFAEAWKRARTLANWPPPMKLYLTSSKQSS